MKLVFSGTKNGRVYVEELIDKGEKVLICTATKYGGSLYKQSPNLIVHDSKMNVDEMCNLVCQYPIDEVIDITHPYAVNVTNNIIKCTNRMHIPYKRIYRDSYFDYNSNKNIKIVEDYKQAMIYLKKTEGNILLTTGSTNLKVFAENIDINRLLIRVLPTSQVVLKCETLGFSPKNIIAMQGPFSYELNSVMYKDYGINYMVTKDSGKIGGVEEKIIPALENDIDVVLIKRP